MNGVVSLSLLKVAGLSLYPVVVCRGKICCGSLSRYLLEIDWRRCGLEKAVWVELNIKVSEAAWHNGYIVGGIGSRYIQSSESEEEEEEVSKGLESPSRVGKDSEPVERVDVFGEGDDGGRMTSSQSPRGSSDQMSDDVDTSMLSTAALADAEFHGVEEAYARYVEYAKVTGFAVRKRDSIKDDEGNVVRKFFYCNRQDLREKKHYERADRKRAHKEETRTNCSAKFVIFLDK
ncbi:uncharacterized protein LOC130965716 [Arachis stenosperma]|uniref:uncharacterized protein LOC130965716 n=1 Tax=Arachis stenosperma TaxID=217475 RepID=UPI0025AD0E17|nr:uncharacterized protein LOC130965716 [Arachis stenosperma]